MMDAIDNWLAAQPTHAPTHAPTHESNPVPALRAAGVFAPAASYTAIAHAKARIVARTGLLGLASVAAGPQLVFRHFLAFGTEAQRAAWAGRPLAVAISEPRVGAHPKLLTTRAEPIAGGFRISGQKAWVTNGPDADAIIVFAITAELAGRKRYSAFIVPRGTPGLGIEDMPGFHALRPSRHCLLTLDGCELPASALLGEPDTAYERMALPFRDLEDAVGTFAILGALRHAIGLFAGADAALAEALGAIVALTSVYAATAESVLAALDAGRFRTGDATLVGLRLLAQDIQERLKPLPGPHATVVTDLAAILGIAPGPRLARQVQLGQAASRAGGTV